MDDADDDGAVARALPTFRSTLSAHARARVCVRARASSAVVSWWDGRGRHARGWGRGGGQAPEGEPPHFVTGGRQAEQEMSGGHALLMRAMFIAPPAPRWERAREHVDESERSPPSWSDTGRDAAAVPERERERERGNDAMCMPAREPSFVICMLCEWEHMAHAHTTCRMPDMRRQDDEAGCAARRTPHAIL